MSSPERKQTRNRTRARAAKRLADEGQTARQIAEALGVKPHQVKGLIALGERLPEPAQ